MEVVERIICGYDYSCEVGERLVIVVVQYNYGGGECIFLCWNMDLG